MTTATIPVEISDPVNARILSVSEDKIQGFLPDPLAEIAKLSGVELPVVTERIAAMVRAGTIRRVRQTLMATNLARGSLVAWQVPEEKLAAAFDYMFQKDPFSGHVVIRSTDEGVANTKYRLWTTLKVPQGFSAEDNAITLGCFNAQQKIIYFFPTAIAGFIERGSIPEPGPFGFINDALWEEIKHAIDIIRAEKFQAKRGGPDAIDIRESMLEVLANPENQLGQLTRYIRNLSGRNFDLLKQIYSDALLELGGQLTRSRLGRYPL